MADDLGLDTPAAGGGLTAGDDVLGGGDDLGLDLGTTATEAPGAVEMPTPAAGDDLSIEMPGGDFGATQSPGPVEMPSPEPQPEPEPSAFSQSVAAADAVEESFDSMFEGLE
jgi:hypothetical protein